MTHTKGELQQMQSLPLDLKIAMTERRIREFYDYYDGMVSVSFSGGKDSTVLLDITRRLYPDVPAVFVNTGLEYPEVQTFAKSQENVTVLRPAMRFDEVIRRYGYPMISKETSLILYHAKKRKAGWAFLNLEGKNADGSDSCYKQRHVKFAPLLKADFCLSHYCCEKMKENPLDSYHRKTGRKSIVATMACESGRREQAWMKTGCNIVGTKTAVSKPMSFWTEQDVLRYIKERDLPIASVYGGIVPESDPGQVTIDDFGCDSGCKLCTTGAKRTGCIFCGFGAHLEKGETRFQRLKRTHPKQYAYCLGGGAYDEDGLWKPDKNGLGMKHVFDALNEIYGKDFIRYE